MDSLPLKDIHLPADVGYWPWAWGWWCLLLACAVGLLAGWWLCRRYRQQRHLRLATNLLHDIINNTQYSEVEKLRALSQWLRRVVLSTAPREQVAGLTGLAWLEYLDRDFPDRPFTQGIGCVLIEVYAPVTKQSIDWDGLSDLCLRWLKQQTQSRGRHA